MERDFFVLNSRIIYHVSLFLMPVRVRNSDWYIFLKQVSDFFFFCELVVIFFVNVSINFRPDPSNLIVFITIEFLTK